VLVAVEVQETQRVQEETVVAEQVVHQQQVLVLLAR
jgi:hypothetical protein